MGFHGNFKGDKATEHGKAKMVTGHSWSIYGRPEIRDKYEVLERVGSGTYSDVYRGRRRSDSLEVALKEVHDYQSAFREIEALNILQNSPNIIILHEYFWTPNEDAVLVLEYLTTNLETLIKMRKKDPMSVGEIKRLMIQILQGVHACHSSSIVHRDLKPSNLLISQHGHLKLADFGQARILLGSEIVANGDNLQPTNQHNPDQVGSSLLNEPIEGYKDFVDEIDKETHLHDANTSCLATYTVRDIGDDPFKGFNCYEGEDSRDDGYGQLTSCVGTRWFRAPELLYGSTDYSQEIDLWSLGCIFSELFTLETLFPGNSDIDQLWRIFTVLGNLNEYTMPGCLKLPDYNILSFEKIENPKGLEPCLSNRSPDEIAIVKKLVCFDPANRATALELLCDKYLNEDPFPVSLSELYVPLADSWHDEDSPGRRDDFLGSNLDLDEFFPINVTNNDTGFSIQFG